VKVKMESKEIRMFNGNVEVRSVVVEGDKRTIGGYAIKYNQQSQPIRDRWGDKFIEEFASGAFDETLTTRNQKSLWNHNMDFPLGSVKAGTLRLYSDATGLGFDNDLPSNTWGNDAYESINRGDVDGVSFGFRCLEDKWSKVTVGEEEIYKRTVMKAELFEISPTTFPAYESSEVSCRSLEDFKKDITQNENLRKKLIIQTLF
jgi:HK97 family phage prohead protease